MITMNNDEANAANDAIIADDATTKRTKRTKRTKVYTDERFVAASAETRVVDAIRALARRGDVATTRAIATRCADVATYREVRQVLRRLRRHHVVDASVVVRDDARRVRVFAIATPRKANVERASD
jgi:hypothetical protein